MKSKNATEAFDEYALDPVVQRALGMATGTLSRDLLRDAFVAGAKYAINRCEEEGHYNPVNTNG